MTSTTLLGALHAGLRAPLIAALNEVCRNYAERRWEPSELNGGKLCEITYTILAGVLAGKFAAKPTKPRDMVAACRALEQTPPDQNRVGDRSIRILIPRMLSALYEIRNNRGVGHAGGDVDPNFLDATAVHSMCRWVVAELIRIFHQVKTDEAQAAVDLLIERKLPVVWEHDGIKRVLPELEYPDQCLVLLYSTRGWASVDDLLTWTEYSNPSVFRSKLLRGLHKRRLVEFDARADRACLTSAGTHDVESRIVTALAPSFI